MIIFSVKEKFTFSATSLCRESPEILIASFQNGSVNISRLLWKSRDFLLRTYLQASRVWSTEPYRAAQHPAICKLSSVAESTKPLNLK